MTYSMTNPTSRELDVIKIGGNQLDDPQFLKGVAAYIEEWYSSGGALPVIVHGGGKQIKALQEKLGIQATYIDGLRVTDPQTMELVQMVLCGLSNVNIVNALTEAGLQAQGYNGADRGLLRGDFMTSPKGDYGRVGVVKSIRANVIRQALEAGVIPVIAPVLLAPDGGYLNCNADKVAGAVAARIGADGVTFLTDVPGVLHEGKPLTSIGQTQVAKLIADGVITGGMAVKLNAALDALSAGVAQAQITNLDGLRAGTGTIVNADAQPER